jgi:membrane protease YdiL (CAAX protease family)
VSPDSTPAYARELHDGSPEFYSEPPHFSHPRIPEDIRVPWGWTDLLLLVGLTVLLTFLIAGLAMGAFSLAGVSYTTLTNSTHEQGLFSVVVQVLLDVAILGYLALQIRLRYQEPFWETIGWRDFDTGVIPRWAGCLGLVMLGSVISFLVDIASDWHAPKGPLPIESVLQDPMNALFFMLISVTLAPLVEETIFRGYIYPVIGKAWGAGLGILLTGALFGGLHGFQLWPAYWQIALLILVGIIFTWVRAKAKTVVASYFLHLGYNGFLFVGFLASTHFLKSMPPLH